MFPTAEVRWFFQGSVPDHVSKWFCSGRGTAEAPGPRVDYYLRLVDNDALGIKLREDKIEIKKLDIRYGIVHFHCRISGLVEGWRKWSFELSEAKGYLMNEIHDSAWVGVTKQRRLQRYQIIGDQVAPASVKDLPDQGGNQELTEIIIEGQEWWSLGFEAFGDESKLKANLFLIVDHVLNSDDPPDLGDGHSCSYPKWLQTLPRN